MLPQLSPVQVDVVENDGAERAVGVGLLLRTAAVPAAAADLLRLRQVPPDHLVIKRGVSRPEIGVLVMALYHLYPFYLMAPMEK